MQPISNDKARFDYEILETLTGGLVLSGLRQEKRIDEKTETEIQKEEIELYHIDKDLESMKRQLAAIKKIIDAADL